MKIRRLLNAQRDVKQHYKMYKAGKRWLYTGISMATLGSALLFGLTTNTEAATSNTSDATSASTETATSAANQLTAKTVALKAGATSSAASQSTVSSAASSTTTQSSATSATSTEAKASTASSAASSAAKQSTAKSTASSAVNESSAASATTTSSRTTGSNATSSAASSVASSALKQSGGSTNDQSLVSGISSTTPAASSTATPPSSVAGSTASSAESSAVSNDPTNASSTSSSAASDTAAVTASDVANVSGATVVVPSPATTDNAEQVAAINLANNLVASGANQTLISSAATATSVVATAAKMARVVTAAVATNITIGNVSKTYNDQPGTPVTYQVILSSNLKAPASWYLSGTNNTMIAGASGDIDLTAVAQDAGIYTITLTAAGLAEIQAANPGVDVTMADVTAGTLTIKQALVPSQAIKVVSQSKDFDNDATNMPTNYQVTLPSFLTAPTTWTLDSSNTAGSTTLTYDVPVSTGDLTNVSSQSIGTYPITLSTQGLSALQAANPNYAVTADAVVAGNFTIMVNNKVIVGAATATTKLPTTLSVTLNDGLTAPTDWTVSYNNTGQNSIVYNVPISYFDTSNVQLGVNGNYSVTLTAAALDALKADNPTVAFDGNNVQDGSITVNTAATASTHFNPGNYYVTIKGQSEGEAFTIADGSGLTLELRLLNNNAGKLTVSNLTEFVIIPSGFDIATVNAANQYTQSSTPAETLKAAIIAELESGNVAYSGLTVTQLTDYNGRQTFEIQFGSVNTVGGLFDLPVVANSDSGTTSGYVGTNAGSPDSSVMYLTSDPAYTQGDYAVTLSGYSNVATVANALGITGAYVLNSSYTSFIYPYTIVTGQVQDTYNLVGPAKTNLGSVSFTGDSQTTYDPMTKLQATIVQNGHTYVLVNSSVTTPQLFPQIVNPIASEATVSTGNTYTVYYQEEVNESDVADQVTAITVQNQAKVYDGLTSTDPTSYLVYVPAGYTVPTDWIATTKANYYEVATSSGDLDLSGITSENIGSYVVKLSDQGLNDFAAANPLYLLVKAVGISGNLEITPVVTTKYVDATTGAEIKTANVDDTIYKSGAAYKTSAAVIDGYVLTSTPANASGTIGGENITVTYQYSQVGDYVVTPPNGGTPTTTPYQTDPNDPSTVTTPTNDPSNPVIPYVPGYTPTGPDGTALIPVDPNDPEAGYTPPTPTSPTADTEINYTADTQTVTVNLVDETGKAVTNTAGKNSYTLTGKTGTAVDFSSVGKVVNGYVLKTDGTSTALNFDGDDATNQTVTLVYAQVGAYVVTPPNGGTSTTTPYQTDPNDPSTVTTPTNDPSNPVIPYVPGYTPTGPDGTVLTPIDPNDPEAGYTPPAPTSPTADTPINYTADTQSATVNLVDETGKAVTNSAGESSYTLTGKTGTAVDFSSVGKVVTGYVLQTDGTSTALNYDGDDTTNQTVTLVYAQVGGYVVTPPNGGTPTTTPYQTDPNDPSTVTTPTNDPSNPVIPYVPGYTPTGPDGTTLTPVDPNDPEAGYTPPTPTSPTADTEISYTADTQTVTVNLVDETGKAVTNTAGKSSYTLTGKTGIAVDFSSVGKVVNGYVLKTDGTSTALNFDGDDATNQTVTLVYAQVGGYVVTPPNGGTPTTTPYQTDPNDPSTVTTPTNDPSNPVIPYVPGYTPTGPDGTALTPIDPNDPEAGYTPPAPTSPTADTEINYTADTQSATVSYVDDTTGKTLIVDNLTGVSGATSSYQTTDRVNNYLLAGYTLVGSDYPGSQFIFDSDGATTQSYLVHLVHGTSTATESKTVNQTIHYQYSDGTMASADVTDHVTFTRTATTDKVTGNTTYTDWTAENGDTSFAAKVSPDMTGYTPDQKQVAAVLGVTEADADINVTVTYAKNDATAPGNPGSAGSSTAPGNPGSAGSSTAPGNPGSAGSSTAPGNPGSADSSTAPSNPGSATSSTVPENPSTAATSTAAGAATPTNLATVPQPAKAAEQTVTVNKTNVSAKGLAQAQSAQSPRAKANSALGMAKLPQTGAANDSFLAVIGAFLVALFAPMVAWRKKKE
ncbi:MBG domain-containing protein [Loigolactobacillus backii]|uniref:MBG domain-containing protein n=1 Tax=Loigolactobacillus backii TaxID=375175 RepID=UPI0022FD6093|nr:MBG domain-containing protein [Loigolactobacillus backii]MDA5387334.1 MBG domain-containing protein [Loigolactobacillus backii]MDA5389873.1 MBG domain-containing protein [Loigolactobacillus backii]